MSITDLVKAVVRHDFADWSRTTIDRLLDGQGWPVVDETSWSLRAPTGTGWALRAAKRGHDDDNGFGEFTSLSMSRPVTAGQVAARHRELLQAAVAELGQPALVGGPHAWAMWRDPQTTTITVSRCLTRDGATLQIEVVPTEPYETETYRNAEYNPDWLPPARWEIRPQPGSPADHLLLGMMTWPHPNATTWDGVTTNIREMFATLHADLPLLHPYATNVVWTLSVHNGPWIAQGWFRPQESRLEVPDGSLILHLTEPDPATAIRFAELTIEAAARATTDPTALRYNAFATVKPQQAHVYGFGLPHEGDNTPWYPED